MRKITCYACLMIILFLSMTFIETSFCQPVFIKVIPSGSKNFTNNFGRLFFTSNDSLWTSDGTTVGTEFMKKTNEPIIEIVNIRLGSFIFFTTLQADGQKALWKTNGTGTNTLKIAAYPQIWPIMHYKNGLLLAIDDGIHGRELWNLDIYDNLSIVKDLAPGSETGLQSFPIYSGGNLYFIGYGGPDEGDLWTTDGTEAGTTLVLDLPASVSPWYLTDVNGILFFGDGERCEEYNRVANLWKTDKTLAGTSLLRSFNKCEINQDFANFISYKDKLYFLMLEDDGLRSFFYTSDGTVDGTKEITLLEHDAWVYPFEIVNQQILITYEGNNSYPGPLIKFDGTTAEPTVFHSFYNHFHDMNHSSNGNSLFFIDNSHEPDNIMTEDEFFQSDMNKENTRSLKEIFGISFANSRNISASVGRPGVYFTTGKKYSTEPLKLWLYNSAQPSDNSPYFTLVNADNRIDISWLKDDDYIFMRQNPKINIRYNDTSSYASVVFKLNGSVYRTDNTYPYTLAGINDGSYDAWLPSDGTYELTATPYSMPNGTGIAGTPFTINFTVVESAEVMSVAQETKQEGGVMDVYPNPSSGNFKFTVESKETGIAKAEIFRLDGSRIETILDVNTHPGEVVEFSWNSKNLPQGIYICRYTSSKTQLVKKLILNK
ncbi:MAG: T9SS type A sorting domain-containing protein [Sporocytophaga sp.]|uniref:T9SS type A sorting domain-containing protein n=1 Tax=Sporocytophaga sp. TaxID=2231183 RepID=UPI001B1280E4|nr:T9SS type A sorting domain-containing protein [Sporocytophaga sp.]MBO9703630.1 T9SS type A sorting domain-containing protein [Sporocytophaga sp.]